MTRILITIARTTYCPGAPTAATAAGSTRAAAIDASDTIRYIATNIPKAANAKSNARGQRTTQTPSAADTPFPPINPRKTEHRPDECGQGDPGQLGCGKSDPSRHRNRNRSFQDIADESKRRRAFAARPHYVGHPDIARAYGARIEAAQTANDDSERNRPGEVRRNHHEGEADHRLMRSRESECGSTVTWEMNGRGDWI